ncbi:MAG: hypothetical protein AVO35_10695 [Candidatus Aegiribacteria sp. MLS_C]|nr:MAG: hypothetical protein AVO35_10695 [Candidatus Aegiribacteria sp. MLS_C]
MFYDLRCGNERTLVVGGGPAGSACAWRLAAAGRPVILAEKENMPRRKVCGGILSSRAAAFLTGSGMVTAEEMDGLTLRTHLTISFWDRGEHLRTYTAPGRPVRIVPRAGFDAFLLERAASCGADVRTGCRVESFSDPRTAVTGSGERLRFTHLVGADGCVSMVRRLISGRRSRKTGMGLHYDIPMEDFPSPPVDLEVHFGRIPYGYIWVIPGRESVNLGAGALGSPASPSDIVKALGRFMEEKDLHAGDHELHGAPIPSLNLDRSLGKGKVYLAGDAAGTVDQVSGEGIGQALESGMMAADCISAGDRREEVLAAPGSCLESVRQSVFYRHLLHGRLTRGTAMRAIRDSEVFAEAYWDIISGNGSYSGIFLRVFS